MRRELEVRRHTHDDGEDALTHEGVDAAVALGRGGALGGYAVVATSGAHRATQTAACVLAGLGEEVAGGVRAVTRLRSGREDDWRAAYRDAGSGRLADMREVAPDLVSDDGASMADGLREVLTLLGDGQRALVVGHSPTNEAAVLSLTGMLIEPLGKGAGVLVVEQGGAYEVHPLDDIA